MQQSFDERNRDLVVNVGGRLAHRDEAGVSPFDSVVQGGDAVWEGLRLHHGRIFALDEHLARLRRSAHALAFTEIPSDADITEELRRTLAANGMTDDVHIRLTLTRGVKVTSGMDPRLNQAGPTLIVLAEFKPPVYDDAGITLITSSVRRSRPDALDPTIHHNNLLTSILAKVEANVAGADDALMLDDAGFVAETNATHVFLVSAGELLHADHPGLPGGDHPGHRARARRLARPAGARGRPAADPGLQRRRGPGHRDDGRPHAGARRRRPDDRPGRAGPGYRPAQGRLRRADRVVGDGRGRRRSARAVVRPSWSRMSSSVMAGSLTGPRFRRGGRR